MLSAGPVGLMLRRVQRIHSAWWMLAVVVLVLLTLNGARSSFAVLYQPLEEDAGWTRVSLAGAASLGSVSMGVAFIVAGLAVDRHGPRRVLPFFALLHLAGYLLTARASEIWQVYFGFGLLGGLAFGVGVGPLLAIVARWFHHHRGLALGIGSSAGQMGAVLFAPVIAMLADGPGWRWTLVLMAVIPFVALLLGAYFLRQSPREAGKMPFGYPGCDTGHAAVSGEKQERSGVPFWAMVRKRELWLACLIYFCINISTGLLLVHVVNHGREQGLSSVAAAGLLSMVTGVSVVGRIGGGIIADSTDFGKLLTGSCLVMAISVGLLGVESHASWLYGVSAFFGLGLGGAVVLQTIVSRHIVGERSLGAAVGMILLAVNLGAASGALMGGAIFEWADSYVLAFLIAAGGAAVAALGSLGLNAQRQA